MKEVKGKKEKKEGVKNKKAGSQKVADSRPKRNPAKTLIIIFVLLIIFGNLFIFLGIKFKFLLYDDLIFTITPSSISINSTNKAFNPIDLNIKTQRFFFCTLECSYKLRDLSTNQTLDNGTAVLTAPSLNKNYNLQINEFGEGQKEYLFEVNCHNKKTLLCATPGTNEYKSALITVNYFLTDEENEKKEFLISEVPKFNEQISNYISRLETANNSLNILDRVYFPKNLPETKTISDKLIFLKTELPWIEQGREEFLALWDKENYVSADNIFEENLSATLDNNDFQLISAEQDIKDLIADYNANIDVLGTLIQSNNKVLSEIYNYSQLTGNSSMLAEADDLSYNIHQIVNQFTNKDYASMTKFSEDISDSEIVLEFLANEYQHSLETSFIEISIQSYFGYLTVKQYNQNFNASQLAALPEIRNLPAIAEANATLADLENSCRQMLAVSNYTATYNQNVLALLHANYSNFENSTALKNILEIISNNSLANASNELLNEFNDSKAGLPEQKMLLMNSSIPSAVQEIKEANISGELENLSLSEIKMLSTIKLPAGFNSTFEKNCLVLQKEKIIKEIVPIQNVSLEKINPEILAFSPNITQNLSISLKEHSPKCCLYNHCSECCTPAECSANASLYPVIFVHGHLTYEGNTPEDVINSFAKMQSAFESIGYIPAGVLDLDSNISTGEWGMQKNPISIRASYYYISYYDFGLQTVSVKKKESIENYAIRLKEIIDEVRRRTGSDKVILIGHSMGGLVCREYLSIFGEENVYKMITIGTPNHGIEGRSKGFCPIIGSEKECEEMDKDSIFMKRLNDPNKIPKTTKVYTIAATGCTVNGKDGDGIVIADDVALDFAENYRIKGKCSDVLQTDLHGRMLDPASYPETFEILKDILQK